MNRTRIAATLLAAVAAALMLAAGGATVTASAGAKPVVYSTDEFFDM